MVTFVGEVLLLFVVLALKFWLFFSYVCWVSSSHSTLPGWQCLKMLLLVVIHVGRMGGRGMEEEMNIATEDRVAGAILRCILLFMSCLLPA